MSDGAHPGSKPPLSAVHHRHKRRSLVIGGLAAVGALVIAGIVLAVDTHQKSGSNTAAGPCGDLQVALETPTTRTAVPALAMQRFTVDVRVGDTVALDASGPCAATVSGSPENASVLRWLNIKHFTAERPGTSRLIISMPMCAGSDSSCRGGVFDFATVTVVVSSA